MATALAPQPSAAGGTRGIARRFAANRAALLSLLFLVVVAAGAALGPGVLTRSPEEIDLVQTLAPPSWEHPLGTDENGRDILVRLVYGARLSLAIAVVAMILSIGVGVFLGGVAGYFGRLPDAVIMRVTDALMAVPIFFLLLTVLTLFGSTPAKITVVIGLTSWMTVSRVVRGEVLGVKAVSFVEAARAAGAGDVRIFGRHILPQAVPSIIVAATLGVAYAILMETALSYLGLGVQPPRPSLGNMLTASQNYLWAAPMLVVYPGVLIFLTVLSFNTLGNGLRDALDPLTRGE